MKNIIYPGMLVLLFALMISSLPVSAQSANTAAKPKSRIVYEEKTVKGKKVKEIDAEEKLDARGNVIEEISYKGGKIDKHMVYEYDADNNKTRETELDNSGKPVKIGEFKYEKGLRTEKNLYDGSKNLISRKTYVYQQ